MMNRDLKILESRRRTLKAFEHEQQCATLHRRRSCSATVEKMAHCINMHCFLEDWRRENHYIACSCMQHNCHCDSTVDKHVA